MEPGWWKGFGKEGEEWLARDAYKGVPLNKYKYTVKAVLTC